MDRRRFPSRLLKRTKASKAKQNRAANIKFVKNMLNSIIDNNIYEPPIAIHLEEPSTSFEGNSFTPVSDPYDFEIVMKDYDEINEHELYVEKVEETNSLDGYRVVDIVYFLNKVMPIQSAHNKKCTGGKLIFLKEERRGLLSKFTYVCNMCNKEFVFQTEDPKKEKCQVNNAAVWATLSTGSTYAHLEELLSILNVPPISRNLFFDIQRDLGNVWKDSLWAVMESAGIEENKLAIERGDVDSDGIPYITVLLDGGWSKRSYGHSYKAASGVAVIIGKITGKLLFLGVRNKYCSICSRAENKNETAKSHICFKNWSGPSTSMEPDIIVEGFKSSISMHGLKYKKFIADGDSSVFRKIKDNVTYGLEVQKVECSNHATKNYSKHLYQIKNDTKTISSEIRKILSKEVIEKLVKTAQRAVYANAHGDVNSLKHDIRNSVHHVFGNHQFCSEYMCKNVGDISKDNTGQLYTTGAHHHIYGALNLMLTKADMLIDNETNNRAELFMSILARFNMGKRLNLIQRDSFQIRSYLTGLRYNEGSTWHECCWQKYFKASPGSILKKFMKKESDKKEKRKEEHTVSDRPVPKRIRLEKSADYGSNIAEVEMNKEALDGEVKNLIERLKISGEVEKLQIATETIGQFNNPRYLTERMHRLTASNFGAVVKRRKSTPCDALVRKILSTSSICTTAMEYGKRYESVAISQFMEKNGKVVQPSGLYVDETHGFLGASPDGIISKNEIVEVKCFQKVALAKCTLEEAVRKKSVNCLEIRDHEIHLKKNHDYYYQIQGQLAITNADICYFVVYTGDQNELFIEKISKDENLWNTIMVPKLKLFYEGCIAPEIILNRRGKKLKCLDPE